MSKFSKAEIIVTDDEGFLAMKSLLPEGSIIWCRNVEGQVAVKLEDNVNISFVEKQLNALYNSFKKLT